MEKNKSDGGLYFVIVPIIKKVILPVALLFMLIDLTGCYVHRDSGIPHHWHPSGRTHRHWGISGHTGVRHNFWGKHRRGPRPDRHRGHYRS